MKLLKLILAFYILHSAFYITSAQVQQDRKIVRGNVTSITVKYPADITADSLIFQVRGTSSYSSNVYIQKKNTVAGGSSSEIATSYTYPYTTATIYFSSANTSGMTIANYYYDLRKSVSPDSAVLIYGTFKIQSYAGEVVNGLAGGGSNESIIKSWIGDSADVIRMELADYVLENDLSDSLDNIRTLIGTGGVALPDSVLFSTDSTAQRTFSDLKYVDEDSSGQSIIGTTATLDSIITDYWNDNLGGSTWDSTYAYQRIVSLEASVSSLEDSISSFRAILNSILTALDTCGCSADLSDNTPTAPPTSLVAHGGEYETQMRITWTDPTAGDLDSIRIYRHTSNDSTGAVWIASVAENIETYTNTGRTANTTYWYWTKALDDSSNLSYFSNSDSGKTLATATADTGFYMLDAEDGVGMLTITGGGITASTDIAYAGTHSYKIAGLGGTTRTYADFDFPVANQDTIWVTYRIYIPTGTAVADGGWNYASLLLSGGDANGDNGEFSLNSSTDVDGWQKPFGTLVSTNFSTNTWHKIEIMYIQGTGANARDYVYVDEDLIYSTNTGAGTVDTDGFRFGAYNWTMASGEAIYFDNIIFSTARLPLD